MDKDKLWMITGYTPEGLRASLFVFSSMEHLQDRLKAEKRTNPTYVWRLWECTDVVDRIVEEVEKEDEVEPKV